MDKLLNSKEIGKYLGLKQVTVRRKALKGEIPATRIGHRFRFNKREIDAWLLQSRPGRPLDILVIDDEPIIGQLFTDSLEKSNYRVTVTLSSFKALELISNGHFDLIFLDLVMPELDGAELFKCIREINKDVPVVIVTGYPGSEIMAKAIEYGPFTVIKKPFAMNDVLIAVHSIFRVGQTEK